MFLKLEAGKHFGIRQRACQIGDLALCENEYAPGQSIAPHCHQQAHFAFVLHGSWREACGDVVRECHPNALTVHPAGEIHSKEIGAGGSRALSVEFGREWLARLATRFEVLDHSLHLESGPAIWLAWRLYAEFRRMDRHSPLVIEGLILEMVGELSRCVSLPADRLAPPWLVRARDLFHAHYKRQLSLAAIAREIGVHPVHLTRTFRRFYGCSIGEYLRDLRLQHACRELAASDRPFAEIAMEAGFCDQSHLCRALRHRTGLTPGAFRKRGA
jgi:AraC family transcriptional regulator